MNRLQRDVCIAIVCVFIAAGIAAILTPTLVDMYFSSQPVMTLEESHNATLHDGYGKVYVVRASVPEIYNNDVEIVKDKINCKVNQYDRIWFPENSKIAGAWNPVYAPDYSSDVFPAPLMRQEDRFYVVWVFGGCE